jgi:hypothetical protein
VAPRWLGASRTKNQVSFEKAAKNGVFGGGAVRSVLAIGKPQNGEK